MLLHAVKFLCPYCHHDFGDAPKATCPDCHRTMRVPAQFTKGYAERRERKRRKARIEREAERRESATQLPSFLTRRKPTHLFLFMIVLVLVGGALLSRVRSRAPAVQSTDRRTVRTRKEVDVFCVALRRFARDCGRYPSPKEGLEALVRNPGLDDWDGPYVSLVRLDPWGAPFRYAVSNNVGQVRSTGRDRVAFTADDFVPTPEARTCDLDTPLPLLTRDRE